MIDALDAVHVAGGDRMQRGDVFGAPSASKRAPIAASTASGQPSPLDEETDTTMPSLMSEDAAAAETTCLPALPRV